MMIMRFHKLIQSRLLWLVFLGVLVFSFVGWGVATSGNDQMTARLDQSVGKVAGKDVTFLRFDTTRRMLANQAGQQITADALDDMTFTHLAMVAYTEKMGIEIPESFAKQQFAQLFLTESGELDEESLANFRQSLRGGRITENDYIRFIREELLLRELQRSLASSVLLPGFDVDRWAGSQTDSFTLEYAAIGPDVLDGDIEVTDGQVEAFFAENRERFQLPEERSIRFLSVDIASFSDQVLPITKEQALAHYQSEPETYVRSVEQPAESEEEETVTVQEPVPFEDVKADIQKSLHEVKVRNLAEETAMSYAVKLIPRRGRSGMSMEDLAETESLTLQSAGPFSRWAPVPDLPEASALKEEVFKLELEAPGNLGGPIEAGDAFIVLELVEIIPPRLPELDEVRDRVKNAAIQHHTRLAISEKADDIGEAVRAAMTGETSFTEAAKPLGLNVVTPPAFELRNLNPNRPMIPPELVEKASSTLPGDVIGPVETRFGGWMIGYLADRTPNPEQAAELTPQLKQMLQSQLHFPEIFARFRELKIQPLIQKREPETPGNSQQDAG
ncbi:MAG: SurA N-terminal domain-containing protein [Kiritimatiellia bacterium]